jgi:hypothetical protein
MAYPPIPPMLQLIEDYGRPTKDLCFNCRRHNRFFFLYELVVADATKKKTREVFHVCPWCDVPDDLH